MSRASSLRAAFRSLHSSREREPHAPSSATRRLFPLVAPSSRPDLRSNFPPSPRCPTSIALPAPRRPPLRQPRCDPNSPAASLQLPVTRSTTLHRPIVPPSPSERKLPRRTRYPTSFPPPIADPGPPPPLPDLYPPLCAPTKRNHRRHVRLTAAGGAQPQPLPQSL